MRNSSAGGSVSLDISESQRKRSQLDTSGGPPPKKSTFHRAWDSLMSYVWYNGSRGRDNEVITVHDTSEDDEEPQLIQEIIHLDRVEEVINVPDESADEELLIINERSNDEEDEIPIIRTPNVSTIENLNYSKNTRRDIITIDSDKDEDEEILDVTGRRLECRPVLDSTVSSEVKTTRLLEYVTFQSTMNACTHSPSQSSTTSQDRQRLHVYEDGIGGEQSPHSLIHSCSSPLPEDSASRQQTPKTIPFHNHSKRDTWRRKERDPYRMISKKVIGRHNHSHIKKEMADRKKLYDQINVFDQDAKARYMKMVFDSRRTAPSVGHDEISTNKPNDTVSWNTKLDRSQQTRIDVMKKNLEESKELALQQLNELFPSENIIKTKEEDKCLDSSRSRSISISSPSPSSLTESYRSSCSTTNESLSALQSRIQDLQLEIPSAGFKHDLYNKNKEEYRKTVNNLEEELKHRTKYRLEKEKKNEIDFRTRLDLKGIIIPYPEKKVDEFPELSDEAVQLCCHAWGRGPEGEKFRDGDPPLTRKDLMTLKNLNWLNDEIINAYLNMIVERSVKEQGLPKTYAFNTFFYANISTKGFASVKRWTRKVDIFSYDILLIPVHLKVHWTMAIVEVKEKTILFYDSMGVPDPNVLPCIMKYLMEESLDKKKVSLVSSEWKLISPSDIPHQQNGSDCGVFSCKFADFGSRRCPLVFSQSHMPYYRQRMVFQLCKNDLSAY